MLHLCPAPIAWPTSWRHWTQVKRLGFKNTSRTQVRCAQLASCLHRPIQQESSMRDSCLSCLPKSVAWCDDTQAIHLVLSKLTQASICICHPKPMRNDVNCHWLQMFPEMSISCVLIMHMVLLCWVMTHLMRAALHCQKDAVKCWDDNMCATRTVPNTCASNCQLTTVKGMTLADIAKTCPGETPESLLPFNPQMSNTTFAVYPGENVCFPVHCCIRSRRLLRP